MLDEQVRRIMAPNPLTVSSTDNLASVSEMMVNKQLQQVPVVDDGKFMGIVTSYDVWQMQKARGDDPDRLVKDVMNSKVIKISPKDKMGTAAELFMDKRFKTLPVVNLRNELKGVITAFDVIKYVFKNEYPHPSIYNSILNEHEPAAH